MTNVMIYWVTQTINTSIRTYAEEARANWTGGLKSAQKVNTPTGVALFPGEAPFPIEWANRMVNVKSYTKKNKGGHFAALDAPEEWTTEIRGFFYDSPK